MGDELDDGSVDPGGSVDPSGSTDPPALVECYSGSEYAERPVALFWQGQRLEIEQVEAQWRIPGGKRFRVRTRDGQVFELLYGELYDEWRVNPAG